MTIENNGDQSCVANLESLNQSLDQYEKGIIFDNNNPDVESELEQYFKMSISELGQVDGQQAAVIAVKLVQYGHYIQRLINKESGVIRWCDAVINKFCVNRWTNFSDFIKSDIKIGLIIKDDEAMQMVSKIKNHAIQRKERLNQIPENIKYLSSAMIEISRSKR